MLKFESLELTGFKSFADKTQVAFNDGVTTIIGPNGCGKSNLFDAIGWVLGGQSARLLRGETMEDVIFNGTGKRKASGLAQVTLSLRSEDEASFLVNGREFQSETVEISRKLYRSGESQYLINQRRCRLKDIQQVMEDLGLGYASYALIAQGKIDSFLTGKPMDRRAIIEEAARITGYKSRRRSAELKLDMAQQNLLRIHDIVAEIERRLRSLKRQAARARRYREVRDEFRQILRLKFALEGRVLCERLGGLQQERGLVEVQQRDLNEQLTAGERQHEESTDRRDRLEVALGESRQRRSEIILESDRVENSIRYHEEQIASTHKYLSLNHLERQSIQEAIQAAADDAARFEQEKQGLAEEEDRIESAMQEHSWRVDSHAQELSGSESEVETLRSRLLELSAQSAALHNLAELSRQRLDETSSRSERLRTERNKYSLELAGSDRQKTEKVEEISGRGSEMSRVELELAQAQEEKARLEDELDEIKSAETDLNNQLIAHRERLQSLQEVELNHSNYSEGVRNFLNHLSQTRGIETSGTLADAIETSPEYEKLVEEFLDEELEYVLVNSMDEAVRGISEIKALKGGRCTFLSIHSSNGFGKGGGNGVHVETKGQQGVFGTLGELLQMKSEVGAAFNRVLPHHAQAIVVSDLDRAFQMAHSLPESTFITLEGETLTPRGLLSASSIHSKGRGLLGLKRQKRELEKKISASRKSLLVLSERRSATQARLEGAAEACSTNQQTRYQLEKQIIGLQHQKEQLEREVERQQRALLVVDQELTKLAQEQNELRSKLQGTELQLAESANARRDSERMLDEKQSALSQLRIEAQRIQDQLHMVRSDRKVLEERRQALSRTLRRIDEQREGLAKRLEASEAIQSQSRQRLDTMTLELGRLQSALQVLKDDLDQADLQLTETQTQYDQWKTAFPAIETQLRNLRAQKNSLQEKRSGLDVELARSETQLLSVKNHCQEQLGVGLEELADTPETEATSLDQVSADYTRLRQTLDSFGPINMTALDEYQENHERYQFLTSQRQDIESSIADTTRVIQDLNRRSREKFKEAFETVNLHFKEVFQKLFGGGDCGMELLDEEDVLESGVDIYAQPPGKKLQNVMLLSGGEKALTVLALLVGLFSFRPSRFCILDEVDAPLDDANVGRFTRLVKEMSRETQLILITHNKHTMEVADTLFGVTMSEPGVSQVLSVHL